MRMNNSEVGHAWYYNNESNTKAIGANNFFYSGDTIYSYGSHYPIARKVNDVVLFTIDGSGYPTTSSYGSTTAQHVSIAARAIPTSATIIYVDNPAADCKRDHKHNYADNLKLIDNICKLIAKGRGDTWAQDRRIKAVQALVTQMNQYTRTFKLGKRQLNVDTFLDPVRLAEQKKKEQKLATAKRKREQQRQQELEALNRQQIKRWKAGENVRISWSVDKCYLRIKDDMVETSKGANIKLRRALRLFDYITAVNNNAIPFTPQDFGPFRLSRVTPDHIIIGCHTIDIDEINRLYNTLEV